MNTEYSCICQGAGGGIFLNKKYLFWYSCYQTTWYQITFNQHYRILHHGRRRVSRMWTQSLVVSAIGEKVEFFLYKKPVSDILANWLWLLPFKLWLKIKHLFTKKVFCLFNSAVYETYPRCLWLHFKKQTLININAWWKRKMYISLWLSIECFKTVYSVYLQSHLLGCHRLFVSLSMRLQVKRILWNKIYTICQYNNQISNCDLSSYDIATSFLESCAYPFDLQFRFNILIFAKDFFTL